MITAVPSQPGNANCGLPEINSSLFDPHDPFMGAGLLAFADSRLSDRDVLVFRRLCHLWSNAEGSDHQVELTYAGLTTGTGLTRHHVMRSTRDLANAGYLDVRTLRRPSPSGHGWVNGPTRFTLGQAATWSLAP